ncbi:MAG: hypothetical protein ACLP5H_10225 [Desulfomonilaceae bacterium]
MSAPRQCCSATASREPLQPDSLSTSGAARSFAILTLVITFGSLVGAVLFSGVPLRGDAGILLDCARLITHGWVPYVDYVEMNPPLAHYINTLPVYLANISGLQIPTAFCIFVLVLVVYSAAALLFLLSRLTPVLSLPSRLVLAAVCLLFSLWVLRASEFGQKDHLFALVYVPWLYCRVIRHGRGDMPTWVGIVIGLIAGPMFLLKPHFCVLVALVEAWLLFLSRRFSTLWCPEILALGSWVVAYAVHFCFVPSEMRDEFFFRWLPFVLANYDVYDHSISHLMWSYLTKFWVIQIPLIFATVLLILKLGLPNSWKLQLHGLIASMLLAYGIFVAQHKGWTYHLLPTVCFQMQLAATLVIMALERAPAVNFVSKVRPAIRKRMFFLVCFCLSLLSMAMTYALFESGKIPDSVNDFVRVIKQQVAPDEKVAFISTSVSPAYPSLIYAKRLPGTRFLQAFPIAYLYKGVRPGKDGSPPYRSPSEATPEERRFLNELGSDILKQRPKLVFIEAADKCQACPRGFRVEEYLTAAGWLQSFMKNYRMTGSLHGFSVYVRVN